VRQSQQKTDSHNQYGTPGVTVACVGHVDGKRVRNKKLKCFICKAKVLWLSRHFARKHSDNYMVAHALCKKGTERKNGLKRLTNLGAFHHNIKILRRKQGILTVVRRHSGKKYVSATDYLPCTSCYGFYHKYDIRRHKCPCRETREKTSDNFVEGCRNMLEGAVAESSDIYPTMNL
jgi:hypothetical protein